MGYKRNALTWLMVLGLGVAGCASSHGDGPVQSGAQATSGGVPNLSTYAGQIIMQQIQTVVQQNPGMEYEDIATKVQLWLNQQYQLGISGQGAQWLTEADLSYLSSTDWAEGELTQALETASSFVVEGGLTAGLAMGIPISAIGQGFTELLGTTAGAMLAGAAISAGGFAAIVYGLQAGNNGNTVCASNPCCALGEATSNPLIVLGTISSDPSTCGAAAGWQSVANGNGTTGWTVIDPSDPAQRLFAFKDGTYTVFNTTSNIMSGTLKDSNGVIGQYEAVPDSASGLYNVTVQWQGGATVTFQAKVTSPGNGGLPGLTAVGGEDECITGDEPACSETSGGGGGGGGDECDPGDEECLCEQQGECPPAEEVDTSDFAPRDVRPGAFTDLAASAEYSSYIDFMRASGISDGCRVQPSSMFCPSSAVTRAQMAVFIVRSVVGDGFTYQGNPYFQDVPMTNPLFPYIQKMKELGFTSGCSATTYCPTDPVTRGEMAVFVIRAQQWAANLPINTFTYTATNWFPTDVSVSDPFFPFIQKMKDEGITSGCGPESYCPATPVARQEMAVFVERAFFPNGGVIPGGLGNAPAPADQLAAPSCGVSLSSNSVANGSSSGLPTTITFARTGNLTGQLSWGVNGQGDFVQPGLRAPGSSLQRSYNGIKAGNYTMSARVTLPGGLSVACGSFSVSVMAATPSASPPVAATCTVSANTDRVANTANGAGIPTSITFSRTGSATGDLYWGSNGSPPFDQPGLGSPGASTTLSYLGAPTGVYNVTAYAEPSGASPVPCGSFAITVVD